MHHLSMILVLVAMALMNVGGKPASADGRSESSQLEPMILIESQSPHGNAIAVLEDDGRTVYLYLKYTGDDGSVLPVWVANRVTAPAELDQDSFRRGEPPLNPAEYCAHPRGRAAFDPPQLQLVWLPEGDGVALYEQGKLLAAIPGWAGEDGFSGYSRDARGQGPLAWALTDDNSMYERFAAAQEFWRFWGQDPDPWPLLQEQQMAALESRFGKHKQYFAIDGGEWPPKALVRFQVKTASLWVTVGMAARPMPTLEQYVDDTQPYRRIELGIVLPPDIDDELMEDVADYVAWLAELPWEKRTWLGPGHTVPFSILESFGYSAVALLGSPNSNFPVNLPAFQGDPINLMWLVPISADERARARAEGTESVTTGLKLPRPWPRERAGKP